MNTGSPEKVRIAPSPTGFFHIGTAQSALYNWLTAKKAGGEFHVRIEDTDKERSTKEFEQTILDGLAWLDLKWDGELVHQSERVAHHKAALEQLLQEGKAFYCHHSQEELEAERKEQEAAKQPPRHICEHKNSDHGQRPGGIIRLAVGDSDKVIAFDDVIRGHIEFKASLLGDFSIARSIDDPLYNLAVVIDDADTEITTVIRGEDHISNTPKQILIYEALGLPVPRFAHLPLILAADRSKLSKRNSSTALLEYQKDYLPSAIVNFLGCLSYTFSREILSKEEMIAEFDLAKVHKSGAVFDIKKLNWINSQYIKQLSPKDFKEITGLAVADAAVPLVTERLEKLSDAQEFSYLWEAPAYAKELLIWKNSSADEVRQSLEKSLEAMENLGSTEDAVLRPELERLAGELGNKGLVFWPLRVALSGKDKSPDPVQIASALGKEETLKRIQHAIQLLG